MQLYDVAAEAQLVSNVQDKEHNAEALETDLFEWSVQTER